MSVDNYCDSDEESLGINKDTRNLLNLIHHYVKEKSADCLINLFDDNHETLKHCIRDFHPSLLHEACKYADLPIVHLLLSYFGDKLNINEENEEGSPLTVACRFGKSDIVDMLIKMGARFHYVTNQENSPLYVATQHGHIKIVENLFKLYKEIGEDDILSQPDVKQKLLYLACFEGYEDLVKYFMTNIEIDLNASISDQFDAELRKPLCAALNGKYYDIVEYLIDKGAFFTESFIESYGESVYMFLSNFIQQNDKNNQNMQIKWSKKGLKSVRNEWLMSISHKLSIFNVDLSYNHLESVQSMFPKTQITSNEILGGKMLHLKYLDLSHNKLSSVPVQIFQIPVLETLDLSYNLIVNLTEECENASEKEKWNCPSLTHLYLARNELTSLTPDIQEIKNLKELSLSGNNLTAFVEPWKCPLEILNLSQNQLNQLPEDMPIQWGYTLKSLDLSSNRFTEICTQVCELEELNSLNLSNNEIKTLPNPKIWKCKHLEILNLSNNQLGNDNPKERQHFKPQTTFFQKILNTGAQRNTLIIYKELELHFPSIFHSSLKNLNLSNNLLDTVPMDICQCEQIIDLDLSGNFHLHELPLELGNLKECFLLRLEHLKLLNIPENILKSGHLSAVSKAILAYLRSQLRKEVSYYQMKMMVVGKEDRGKTTLTAKLQGLRSPPNVATNGVKVNEWKLMPSRRIQTQYKDKLPNITLSVWDMGGQPDYYVTHQCFLTPNALYLVVWNITLNQEGVNNLKPWLLNIEARAPKSSVIIVATFLDVIPANTRRDRIRQLHILVEQTYCNDRERYPYVMAIHEVSCKTGEGIPELRDSIYKICLDKLSKKKVPNSYVALQKVIKEEAVQRAQKNEKPVLNSEEFDNLVKQIPNNDIQSPEDLTVAINFLQESGVLLHYSDLVHNSQSAYYFIEPSWLCALLAKIITVKESNVHVIGGMMSREKAKFLFKDEVNCDNLLNFCMEILQKFEIALYLNSEKLLIPSKLPEEKPGIIAADDDPQNIKTVRRIYKMPYIPAGFWSRLITRLMINMQFLTRMSRSESNFDEFCTSGYNYSGIKQFRIHQKNQVFWREGIFITYIGGSFTVESLAHGLGSNDSGIIISIHSETDDFAAMGFIVDQVESLIQEWYPGLANSAKLEDQIQRLVPCPYCRISDLENSNSFSSSHFSDYFSVDKCAAYALYDDHMPCPKHKSTTVPLILLIPDLLLSDVAKRLLLNKEDLCFSPTVENCIGKGGAGCVYKGFYQKKLVAIKQFHDTINMNDDEVYNRYTDSGLTLIFNRTFKSFVELRQEVTLLSMLNHSNIVSLIGFSIRPLCFALEMAPLGSLASLLDDVWNKKKIVKTVQKGQKPRGLILPKFLSYKIVLQVAGALEHLHHLGIIYRDLKSDNVLVWSCEVQDTINVKISDYGISKLCAPGIGIQGMEGTPGYLAPEIIKGFPYNEKVDVFSFAMFIYELITGYRPFYHLQYSAEINKNIKIGIRPNIKEDNVDPQFHELESMMETCWHDSAFKRPSTSELLNNIKSLAFLSLETEKHLNEKIAASTYILTPNPKESIIWICHYYDGKRNFNIYNIEEGTYKIRDQSIPGSKNLSMVELTSLGIYWLSTEDGKLEILVEKGGNITQHNVYDLNIKISVMIKKIGLFSIFAGCSNGKILVFDSSQPSETSLKNYLLNYENWTKKEIEPFESNSPVNSVIQEDQKLWINNNDGDIVVINLNTLETLIKFNTEPTIPKLSRLIQIDDSVWSVGLENNEYCFNVYEIEDFSLRRKLSSCAVLTCPILNEIKLTRTKSSTDIEETNKIKCIKQETSNIRQRKKSTNDLLDWYNKQDISSTSKSGNCPVMKKIKSRKESISQSDNMIDSTASMPHSSITDMKLIKDTLWIGKSCGSIDIISVDLRNENYGKVISSLQNTLKQSIYHIILSNENVISLHSSNNSLMILRKWKSYDAKEISNIYKTWKSA